MPGTVAITFSDAAGRDSAVSAGTPLPVTAGGATPAGQTPPASEAPVPIGGLVVTSAVTSKTAGTRQDVTLDEFQNVRVLSGLINSSGADGFSNSIVGYGASRSSAAAGSFVLPAVGTYGFNGTSWDRQRGDTRGTLMQKTFTASRWNYVFPGSGINNSTAEVTLIAAAGAGVRNFLLGLQVDHESLTSIRTLELRDGPSGTVLYKFRMATGTSYRQPIILPLDGIQTSVNTALVMAMTTADTGFVNVHAQGGQG